MILQGLTDQQRLHFQTEYNAARKDTTIGFLLVLFLESLESSTSTWIEEGLAFCASCSSGQPYQRYWQSLTCSSYSGRSIGTTQPKRRK